MRVIGVVAHIRQHLENAHEDGGYYEPILQAPAASAAFVVRGSGNLAVSALAIRETIRDVDKTQPLFNVGPMEGLVEESLETRRLVVMLLEVFSLFALMLAGVGLYGVISYAVSQRTFEIGIRVALGAERRDVIRLVAGQGLGMAAMGTAAGVVMSVFLGRSLQQQLFRVSAFDGEIYLAAAGFLFVMALVASLLPAWRALRIDPRQTLQQRS